MHHTVNALVLSRTDVKESDCIMTLLSRQLGKISARARRASARTSQLAAGCQLFAWSEFTLFENKGYYTVTEAVPTELFEGLRESPVCLSLGAYIAEALSLFGDSDSDSGDLLRLGLNCLFGLSGLKKPPELVRGVFTMRALSLAGYAPETESCPICGGGQRDPVFSPAEGAVICKSCLDDPGEPGLMPVSPRLLAALRMIVEGDDRKILNIALGDGEIALLAALSKDYLEAQLGHSLGTLEFYLQMIG